MTKIIVVFVIPIILSILIYSIYHGNFGNLYDIIPTELRGWILMSILGPITSTLLSTNS